MSLFLSILNAALISIFMQNSIFERALGSNILLYASKKKGYVIGFSLVITYISVLSSIAAWYIDNTFGEFEHFEIILPLIYILVISIIYILSLIIIWAAFPKLFVKIKTFVHISVFNCSVLGAMFLNSQFGSDIGGYIGFGLGTGIGFFVAGYLLYIAHHRLNNELVPSSFRGIPIMLVYVGVLSLSLYAFVGYSTAMV